jgi:hypothetical protein
MSTLDEARRFLLNLLPPGAEPLYSLVPGGDAFAAAVKQFGFDLLDVLRLEITPAECIQKLADRESALALVSTQAALHGTTEQHRAGVLSRLREAGGFTRPLVRAVIAPLLGFLNPATLQILNTDRVAMRATHTYTGSDTNQPTPGTFRVAVIEDGQVTKAGAQLSIMLTTPALDQINLQLSTPDGKTKTWRRRPCISPLPGLDTVTSSIWISGIELDTSLQGLGARNRIAPALAWITACESARTSLLCCVLTRRERMQVDF